MSTIWTAEDESQTRVCTSREAPPVELKKDAATFVPPPHEVAARAYFTYLNEGSPQGQEERHWLEAEAQLVIEQSLAPARG